MSGANHGRFGDWYGTWCGPIELRSGQSAVMRLQLTPRFNGSTAEVSAVATSSDGEVVQYGSGFWWVDENDVARCAIFGSAIGFAALTAQPDDPDVLAFSGPHPDGGNLSIVYSLGGDAILLSAFIQEGYPNAAGTRTVGRLQRVKPRERGTA